MISPKERAAHIRNRAGPHGAFAHMRNRTGPHGAFAIASAFKRTSKRGSQMDGKGPRPQTCGKGTGGKGPRPQMSPPRGATKGPRMQAKTKAETNNHQAEDKITISINANLLKCSVCFGPLTPPLFQCTKGHVSCSGCCTEGYEDDENECLMCHEPETTTRCRAMEHILANLHVACPFQQYGCTKTVPYASEQAHKASCAHAPRHCPISGCAGYAGKPLREHVQQDHPFVARTVVPPRCRTALGMRAHEQARVVRLDDDNDGDGDDSGAEFLVVAAQYKQLGRALSVVRLVHDEQEDFKHRIEVVGKAGVLSLSGETMDAERLAEPYEANPFLFVPNEIWDSPEGVRVFIELK